MPSILWQPPPSPPAQCEPPPQSSMVRSPAAKMPVQVVGGPHCVGRTVKSWIGGETKEGDEEEDQ